MSFVGVLKSGRANREREGLDLFVSCHRETVYRLALSITGRRDMAEDVCQDVLIRAYRHHAKLSDSEDPLPWLRLTTVRRAMTELKRHRELDTAPEASAIPNFAEQVAVAQTLAQLKPEQRTLLALALGEGWSYQEIADSLEIPVGTVASRLSTAKAAFRNLWGEAR